MTTTMTVKGQVTIPKAIREAAGIKPGDRVDVSAEPGKRVVVVAVPDTDRKALVRAHYDRLMDIAKRETFKGFTTEELMALTRGED